VQPNDQTVSVFDLIEGKFVLRGIYHRHKIINLKTINLDVDLNEIFPIKD
jgi:hypothetical protein